ncbi:universal stress protein UspA, partial [Halobacteriales archaeon QH_3_68_24]
MRGSWRDRVDAALARARRVERRELRDLRRWVERTESVVHLSVLVFVPLLVALVTALSNTLDSLSFLLFPPLAAGTYTLFANPEGRYASPAQFVAGLTIGALCGWGALTASDLVGLADGAGSLSVGAAEAALAVFATGVASTIVAAVFYAWRERFYERRATLLYESVEGDDRVLVPMRGENPHSTAMLAARLAGAHDAGKVVLLDLAGDADAAATERGLLADRRGSALAPDGGDADTAGDAVGPREDDEDGVPRTVSDAVERLERRASEIETQVGVPCQVAVAAVGGGSAAATVRKVASETNCDLVAAPYEERDGELSPFVRGLFRGRTDVLVHRSRAGRTRWRRVLVPVRRAS